MSENPKFDRSTGAPLTRREFLTTLAITTSAFGLTGATVPFIKSLGPSKDLLATGVIDVDLSDIGPGKIKLVEWRQQPIFILRRTPAMIESADRLKVASLADPASPEDRVIEEEWLVCIGICTHLGCIPRLINDVPGQGMPGFLCPCHGGQYDSLGRRLGGPPPQNLHLLPYKFLGKNKLRLGSRLFSGYPADIRKIADLPPAG